MIGIILAAGLIVIFGAWSYRKARQHSRAKILKITTPNSIVESQFVNIGGIQQWIGIRGEDRTNPVIVILHGGPGQPYSPFSDILRSWEEHFTLVQWDQRGAGKTLGRNGKRGCGALSLEQLGQDSLEVVEYVRKHLHKDKVILLASSAGTLISIPLILEHPQLFSAYVASDQNVNMGQGNDYSYNLTLERLRKAGDTKKVAQFEKIGPDPAKWDDASYTRKQQLVMSADPYMKTIVSKLLLPGAFFSPTNTLRDAINVFRGFQYTQKQLLQQILTYDIRQYGTKFEVPIFLFQGEHDILSPAPLAEAYFAEMTAPKKVLAPIKDAGHFAMLTQPGQFLKHLTEYVLPAIQH